jgi:hypothetical protein
MKKQNLMGISLGKHPAGIPREQDDVIKVGFEVLTAVSTKMAVFWVVAPCSVVGVYQRFRGPCCLIALMMEAARTSETLVNFYQTTRRYNPEDSHLRCY